VATRIDNNIQKSYPMEPKPLPSYKKTVIQLILMAQFPTCRKILLKKANDGMFVIPLECLPTRQEEKWTEDIRDTVDDTLGKDAGFNMQIECQEASQFRASMRDNATRIMAYKAIMISDNIGIDPVKAKKLLWVTLKEVSDIPADKIDENDQQTLISAFRIRHPKMQEEEIAA
jgi:hypothetical protein